MSKKQLSQLFTASVFCTYHVTGATNTAISIDEPVNIGETTTITITDEVLVHDTIPLGINTTKDSYYAPGVMLKVRDAENFEGTSYRQIHEGTLFEDGFASCWAKVSAYENTGWADLMRNGGQYTLISGPAKWTTGNIAGVSTRTITCGNKGEKEATFFAFDTEITLPEHTPISKMGLMVENLEPVKHGHTGKLGAYWYPSDNSSLIEGDTPPTSFGYASLAMDGTEKPAIFRLSTHKQEYANLNGVWKYRLWAKVKEGNPKIVISPGKYGEAQEITISSIADISSSIEKCEKLLRENELYAGNGLFSPDELFPEDSSPFRAIYEIPRLEKIDETPLELFGKSFSTLFSEPLDLQLEMTEYEWKKYEFTFQIDDVPEFDRKGRSPFLVFLLTVTDGILMVDDLEIEIVGDTNPTAFRDEIVTALKNYNPGVIRKLKIGGQTVKNIIMPRLKSHRGTNSFYTQVGTNVNSSLDAYGLHEFYELAEHIGSEPWYCLPGTINKTEIKQFMEYLGAPADVGWGALRAELGHPEPWTESLGKIHIELGDEAWNVALGFKGGGFNGPDYWHDLFAIAKESPYYQDNIIFHAAGQHFSSWMANKILTQTPNADRYAIAPYQHHVFNQRDIDLFRNDSGEILYEQFFSWFFARSLHDVDDRMLGHKEVMDETGVEYSIYEVNHSPLKGDLEQHEIRNQIATSLGAGLNMSNFMLQLLKKYHIRTQAFFNFSQFAFNMSAYGLDDFSLRVWGGGLNFRQGHERSRPTLLANTIVNKVLAGDLLKTIHSGADPTYTVTGPFEDYGDPETRDGFPEIVSYAFAKDNQRGLILYNLSTTTPHQVSLQFEGEDSGVTARSWLLTADSITANNEPENEIPQVQVTKTFIEEFRPGISLTLPQHSLKVISWTKNSLDDCLAARADYQEVLGTVKNCRDNNLPVGCVLADLRACKNVCLEVSKTVCANGSYPDPVPTDSIYQYCDSCIDSYYTN